MNGHEQAYAGWLNILGSEPVTEPEAAHELRVLRIVAQSTGDSERFSQAYMDVLLALAPQIKDVDKTRGMVKALVDAARAHRVPYTPGLPMMIDGIDCSPDAVRALTDSRDHYRSMVLEQAVVNGAV